MCVAIICHGSKTILVGARIASESCLQKVPARRQTSLFHSQGAWARLIWGCSDVLLVHHMCNFLLDSSGICSL